MATPGLVGVPKHPLNAFGVKDKAQASIEIHDMGVGEEGDITDVSRTEFANCIFH